MLLFSWRFSSFFMAISFFLRGYVAFRT